MLENGVFNRPYVRDITKICECACSMNCDKNATELRPDRNPDIITNADRIRAMTDEELSYFLCDFRTGSAGEHHCAGCKSEEYCRTGHNGMIEWLQQPAEED